MTQIEERLSRGAIMGLVAMGVAVLVIANDFTALSVALPAMEQQFHAGVNTVQWVINGYALVFGVLIVSGGRLADMFGRRRIFFIGSVIFAVASVLGGFAPSVGLLLTCRAVMGIGGAMMWPAILGMTYGILPAAKAGLAGGIILGAAGFGNAVGPLLGGVLTDWLSWRWIFFLNLPITAFAMFITWRIVPADGGISTDHRIDYAGIVTLSLGLVALLLALDEGTSLGWTDSRIVGLFVFAGISLAAFAVVEMRAGVTALVPKDVLKNRAFFAACMTVLLMSAIFFSALLYLPQFTAKVLNYSAAACGAGLLPMMGVYAVTSFVAGPLYEKLGPKVIVSFGSAFLAAGIFMLSFARQATTYAGLIPGMAVLGVGVGLFYSSVTTAAVTALDPTRTSLAGGIIYMFQIAGGSIGLGLNTAIVVTSASLPQGIETAFRVDTTLAVCGLVVALLFVGGKVNKKHIHKSRHHHRAHGP